MASSKEIDRQARLMKDSHSIEMEIISTVMSISKGKNYCCCYVIQKKRRRKKEINCDEKFIVQQQRMLPLNSLMKLIFCHQVMI